jgi:hypothetical protein
LIRKDLPEKKARVDQGESYGDDDRGSNYISLETKKTNALDRQSEEERDVTPSHAQQSAEKNDKSDHGPPITQAKASKSAEQSTPQSKKDRDVQSDHGIPKTSTTNSKSKKLTPPRRAERDVIPDRGTPKTSSTSSRSEQASKSPSSPKDSSTRTPQNDASKSHQSSTTKRPSKDRIESPKSPMKSSNKTSPAAQDSSPSASRDKSPQEASTSSNDAPNSHRSSSDSTSPQSSVSARKEMTPILSSIPDMKRSRDETIATALESTSEEVTVVATKRHSMHHGNESNKAEKNVKWPQSALATQKCREPPKPQREASARRRIRESHGNGVVRRVESCQGSSASHRNEVDKSSNAAVQKDVQRDENQDSKTTTDKGQTKEPMSASGNDYKSKKLVDNSKKDSTDHSDSKRNTNYRDILLGRQSTKTRGNEKSGPKSGEIASSNDTRYEGSNTRGQKPHPEAAVKSSSKDNECSGTSGVEGQHPTASGTKQNPRSTPQARDQEKHYGKEKKSSEKPPYRERRPTNMSRDSTTSRDSSSRTNTNTQRNRHYDTNNNSNTQSRNATSNATKR